jgi:hypothetical protein
VESKFVTNFPLAFGLSRAHFVLVAPDAQRAVSPMLLARLPPLFHSAGLSPIGVLRASEKCAKASDAIHITLTAFPQAPKLCNFTRRFAFEHLFSQENVHCLNILPPEKCLRINEQIFWPVEKNSESENEIASSDSKGDQIRKFRSDRRR